MKRANESWFIHAEDVVRRYPDICRDIDRTEKDVIWKSKENTNGRGSVISDQTGNRAAKLGDDPYYVQVQAYKAAVYDTYYETLAKHDGKKIVRIIRLLYWDRTHTILGAADEVGWSVSQTGRHRRAFIITVAQKLGWCKSL